MNIFMPCKSIEESVRALDDKRLIKQILECEQILLINERVNEGEQRVGYANHPVVKHYREEDFGTTFLLNYGRAACEEYGERFDKLPKNYWSFPWNHVLFIPVFVSIPNLIYAEGSKTSPDCIRETDNEKVFELFKQKLIKKWDNDKYPPKWTNREPPSWYKGERK